MITRQPPEKALAPASPADLAASDRPGALVPSSTIVGIGSSLSRSTAMSMLVGLSGVLSVNLLMTYLLASRVIPERLVVVGPLGLLLAVLGGAFFIPSWLRRRIHRRFGSSQPFLGGASETRGQQVRLVGVVQKQAPLLRTPIGDSAVLVRYQGCHGSERGPGWSSRWRWELHALDFCVRADDGRELWIDTRSLVLLPHPPITERRPLGQRRALFRQATEGGREPISWIYDQEFIGPGDRVEVVGTLDPILHPGASAGSDRQARLRPVLRGNTRQPVVVRRHFPGLPPAQRAG